MSFEDDMIEDGFNDEQEYLDYLLTKSDGGYTDDYYDYADVYDYEQRSIMTDNSDNNESPSYYYHGYGDENAPDAILVKRLLHKDLVITAYNLWESTVSSSEIASILDKWKFDNHIDNVVLSSQFEIWHSWACVNIKGWLFYYDSSVLILAKEKYLTWKYLG